MRIMPCAIRHSTIESPLSISNSKRSKYFIILVRLWNIELFYLFRLWHQISDELILYFKEKAFDTADNSDLLTLYEALVKSLTHKLNPIKYALLTILASRQHADIDMSIAFLDEAKGRLESYRDAVFLCRIAQAEKKLNLG